MIRQHWKFTIHGEEPHWDLQRWGWTMSNFFQPTSSLQPPKQLEILNLENRPVTVWQYSGCEIRCVLGSWWREISDFSCFAEMFIRLMHIYFKDFLVMIKILPIHFMQSGYHRWYVSPWDKDYTLNTEMPIDIMSMKLLDNWLPCLQLIVSIPAHKHFFS